MCSKAGLFRCKACKVACYCGRQCQVADHASHKSNCKDIRKLLDNVAHAENHLRKMSGGFFENHIGDFWAFVGTRDFMEAKQEFFRS